MAFMAGELTLYREKSLFFDGAHPGPDLEEYARLKICANRITWLLVNGEVVVKLVIRGQSLPCCLRLAARVHDTFKADPMALGPLNDTDWNALFADAVSDYDRISNPDTWFSIYANGEKIAASTAIVPAIDELEAAAKGNEIDELFLKKMATVITDRRSIRLQHESTAAIILNPDNDGARCAVIDRRYGKDGGFSFRVNNPPKKRVRLSAIIYMAADIFELQNLYAIVSRVEKVLSGELPKTAMPISLEKVEAIQTRNLQLKELVKSFHESFDIAYRPAAPVYIPH